MARFVYIPRSMKTISREDLRRTAALARVDVPESEVEHTLKALSTIFEYVEQLAQVDVSGVEPMSHAGKAAMPMREDRAAPPLSPDDILSSVPRRAGNFIGRPPRMVCGSR